MSHGGRLVALSVFHDCVALEEVFLYNLGLVNGQVAITGEASIVNLPGSALQNNTGLYWPDWANTSDHIAITATVPQA